MVMFLKLRQRLMMQESESELLIMSIMWIFHGFQIRRLNDYFYTSKIDIAERERIWKRIAELSDRILGIETETIKNDYLRKSEVFLDGDKAKNIQFAQGSRTSFKSDNSNILIGSRPGNPDAKSIIGIGFNSMPATDSIVIGNGNHFWNGNAENCIVIGNLIEPASQQNSITIGNTYVDILKFGPLQIELDLWQNIIKVCLYDKFTTLNLL
jgi:hypothetical protein